MSRFLTVHWAIVLLASALYQARDLARVVNRSITASPLTVVELEKLFKAGIQNWPPGPGIEILLTDLDSPDNRMILQRALKLAPEEIKSFVDTHKALIRVVGSAEDVLTRVGTNPGAIGIVNLYSIHSRVKVVKVDGKLPMKAGYLLHGN